MKPETREKISQFRIGKKCTKETKMKMSEAKKGKKLSEETKKKMSKAHKGISPVWGTGKSKRIQQLTVLEICEQHKERCKRWRENNKEKIRLLRKKYKYNKKKAGILTTKTIQMVYEDNIKKFGTLTCYLCKKPIDVQLKFFSKITSEHLEHKTPLSRGGTNDYENLGIACSRCNNRKKDKTVEEYLNKKGARIR